MALNLIENHDICPNHNLFRDLGVNQSKNDIEEMVAKFSKVKYSEVTDISSFSDFETEKKKIQPKEQSRHSLLIRTRVHFMSSSWIY